MGYKGIARAGYAAIIKGKAERDRRAAMTEEERKAEEWNNLYNEIASLKERIEDILSLAKVCYKNGVKIPECKDSPNGYDAAKKYGYDAEFIADGWRHHTGLDKGANYFVIKNGGACGDIDFYTNGDVITGIFNDGSKDKTQARTEDMKKFLREFPVFEAAFYNWIESLQEN